MRQRSAAGQGAGKEHLCMKNAGKNFYIPVLDSDGALECLNKFLGANVSIKTEMRR